MSIRLLFVLVLGYVVGASPSDASVDSTIRIVYWDLVGMSTSQSNESAITRVVDHLQPDVLIVQHLPRASDTGVFGSAFRRTHDTASVDILYAGSSDLFALVNGAKGRMSYSGMFGLPGANQYSIGVSVDSTKSYSIVVANWPDAVSVDSGGSHVEPAEALLVMAKTGEEDGESAGRVIAVGTFHASSSSDDGLSVYVKHRDYLSSPLVDISGAQGQWDSVEQRSSLHTSSTRSGLVRRTSMALLSESLLADVRSWFVAGNDGSHFGRSVSSGINDSVPQGVASDLESISESLPIVVDIAINGTLSVVEIPKIDALDLL